MVGLIVLKIATTSHLKKISGEAKSFDVNSEDMNDLVTELKGIMAEKKKVIEFKGVDCSGGKRSKERLTVMVCANISGSEKVEMLVIEMQPINIEITNNAPLSEKVPHSDDISEMKSQISELTSMMKRLTPDKTFQQSDQRQSSGIAIGMEVERYRLKFLVSNVISQDMVQVNA
ncbi:unnamed protein product [Mytilus coruscus]|uniref:Uncharacterized protein n=1 Tax=Mytilus coruscus TaxID=42192 RepID=A0A6J8ENR5_MYTCO|nr:unnamed protein product [Mytilus coruscus]